MRKRVLIADDSDVVRELIRSFVEMRTDVEVCAETADGRQTISAALALRPDILILDVVMPELNGLQVVSAVRSKLPHAKVILFTMYGNYVKSVAESIGVDIIIAKPDGLTPLLRALDSFLN
jgi:DNA-binding NarL/FixJ family response regulator